MTAILVPHAPGAPSPAHHARMTQAAHLVVIDACVLMPTILRRLVVRLAQAGVFVPVWSAYIGLEWRRNAARLWDVPLSELEAEWQAMNDAFPLADAGDTRAYETGLRYSDPKDWHVIAAGLAKRARGGWALTPRVTVMTWNLKDFNRSELKRQGMRVAGPDVLLTEWFEHDPGAVWAALAPVLDDAALVGRPADSLPHALHRERLFRLSRLVSDYGCLPESPPPSAG